MRTVTPLCKQKRQFHTMISLIHIPHRPAKITRSAPSSTSNDRSHREMDALQCSVSGTTPGWQTRSISIMPNSSRSQCPETKQSDTDWDHGDEDYDGNEDSVHEGDGSGEPEDEDMTGGSNDPHETTSDSQCSVDPKDSEDLLHHGIMIKGARKRGYGVEE